MKLLPIGYANFINKERIISIVSPDTSPVKRIISEARTNNMLVDATCGRKTRSVFVIDSGHVVLSAVQLATMAKRIDKNLKETDFLDN